MYPEGWFGSILKSKSKTFLAFCFCFLVGAGVNSFFSSEKIFFYIFIVFFIALFLTIIFWSNKKTRFFCLCFTVVVVGSLRFFITIPVFDAGHVRFYNDRTVELIGTILAEPDRRIDKNYYTITVQEVDKKVVQGKVLLKTPLYPEYNYGDKLSVTCRLQGPKNVEDSTFRYDKYLAEKGIWSLCSFPKSVKKISEGHGNLFTSTLLRFKTSIKNRIELLWTEPSSSFMAGMLYGSKQGFSSELMDYFSRTGVTHIIAVSGFNISIIALILMNICVYAGLYRRQAFWLVIFFIVLFVVFTGGSASAVRAAVMGSIVLYAEKSGRTALIAYLLVYTATLMMIINPYVLFWDAGFQLSFLATLGLVYISPVLKTVSIFKKVPSFFSLFFENFISTLSAIIATLPFILFQFGTLSLVAPVVNMLVLWIIPWLMLGGFIALVMSMVYVPLGQVAAFIAQGGMMYVLMVVEWFGSHKWSAWSVYAPWWIMVIAYLLMIQWVRIHLKRTTSYV